MVTFHACGVNLYQATRSERSVAWGRGYGNNYIASSASDVSTLLGSTSTNNMQVHRRIGKLPGSYSSTVSVSVG